MSMCTSSHQEVLTDNGGRASQQVSALQKIGNCCFPPANQTQQIYRYNFYLCQWQNDHDVSILYLIYRWFAAIWFLAVLSCSLLDIGRADEPRFENHYAKWWIDLTNWGLVVCSAQAWLGAMIVTQGLMVDRDDFGMQRKVKKGWLRHCYWILNTIATVYSFIITIFFWTVLHDPERDKIDAINLMVYVFNSVIMLIDLMTVTHPINLNHTYWTMSIGVIYTLFSVVYFIAGGTDRTKSKSIYRYLDWRKPGKAIVVSLGCIFSVFVVHVLVYCLYRFRVGIFRKFCMRQRTFHQYARNDDQIIIQNNRTTKIARTPSSYDESKSDQFYNPSTVVELK
ncbi:protein rolling stone [Sitodiplosis mosellana]|uniref:protein rolling stone n=1 Tax=Sitodiplosis mosellana TaxID=263140 RepID=UPI00244399F0|nr:protein rolling stone [Sitodiplosis mosellana]